MTKPNILDGNTQREMTDEEYAQWQTDAAQAQEQTEVEADAQTAKALARQAVLAKLGITEAEAQLLLG